jgi:lipoprotein-releasing system permease protein
VQGGEIMKLAFKIALRFLKSSKGQTILITLGIAIGVSVQIFIGSLIQGLQKSLVDKTIGSSSQITVVSNKDEITIDNWQDKLMKIKESDSRIQNLSPAADAAAFIETDKKSVPILLRGAILKDADKIYKFKEKLIAGTMPSAENEVLVGKELKEELKLKIDDKIIIFTPKGQKQEATVKGFYDLKVANINKSWVITDLSTIQKIFGFDQKITSIEMQLTDVFAADVIAGKVKAKLSDETLKVLNWKDQNKELLSGLSGQSISSIMIQVFVLISVILGIASVLAIAVLQKSKQLGILKAMGIKDRTASMIFLLQGLILGIMGALLGILFGLGLAYSFTKFALNPDGTPVIALYIDSKFIIVSGIIAVLSATLASLIPAIKSSKLNPIEVIKNG